MVQSIGRAPRSPPTPRPNPHYHVLGSPRDRASDRKNCLTGIGGEVLKRTAVLPIRGIGCKLYAEAFDTPNMVADDLIQSLLNCNPADQAKSQAKWLQGLSGESTGQRFGVRPAVVFAGRYVEPVPKSEDRGVWVLKAKASPTFSDKEPACPPQPSRADSPPPDATHRSREAEISLAAAHHAAKRLFGAGHASARTAFFCSRTVRQSVRLGMTGP